MPLDVAEIVKKVRRIQIVASRQVDDLLAGEYRSVFRGRGMEFDEVREYTPGDDVRTIDWNVTARTGKPYVKRYCEERELTIMFAVDVSASGAFGSQQGSKFDLMIEVCALLMLSAQKNNDKIGLVLFSDDVKAYFPPRKGRAATRRLIRELVAAQPDPARGKSVAEGRTDLGAALSFVSRVQRRRCVVFVISDYQDEGDWERSLRVTNARHDVVAITASDPREHALPPVGFVTLEDPETGEVIELDTRHERVRELFAEEQRRRRDGLIDRMRKSGVDQLPVRTDQPYTASLHRFFRMREGRAR
ncbi:MAG: DUF58 domain-containing protein [Planctomycetota bacterium]|nr:DUF58 domain-containing protein [Planctomycetota bacterium]